MAIGKPKLVLALVVALLAVLAGMITYSGYLVIGVVAEYLGTGRFMAGLLLGVLFARFPSVSQGKLRLVGLLPKPVRRPLIVTLVALCLLHFVWQGDYVPALFTGFVTTFLLAFPWLRKTLFDRVSSSLFKFMPGRRAPEHSDDMVIEGEFKERKD
ncbi:hypothetical protein RCH14_002753 [Massilia sp. MP_M2]|uniref:hypothetical protein n=1 Tax=Massilia sp. MP_M2 TaxID=3071713 RepID=UPI00319E031C